MGRSLVCRAAVVLVLAVSTAAAQPHAPELLIETLDSYSEAEARLRRFDHEQLRNIVTLVGLEQPGAPIRVVLAPEHSEVARATPPWVAGFAHGPSDTIVLFPSRSLRYPHDSLEAVLHHEVAHVLIHRAAAGQPVPRWFNEGLATVGERTWSFEDRRQLAWARISGGPVRTGDIDDLFHRSSNDAVRAYALASAFVRQIIDSHGSDAPARILASLAEGHSFDAAFVRTTGQPLQAAEREFQTHLTSWERWVPLVTSPFVIWTTMTLLALYAIWVRQRRRADRRRKWAAEDDEEEGGMEMGGRLEVIPFGEWRDFLDGFSRMHEGWLITMQSAPRGEPLTTLLTNLPLTGVATDENRVLIAAGHGREHVGHVVERPVALRREYRADGADAGLEIETDEGDVLRLRFRSAVRPELVDGL